MMNELLKDGERIDDLQLAGMRIIQNDKGFRFGMDAVLLSDFATIDPKGCVADFGTGTGILPLLLRGRGKGCSFDALEIQSDMAEMAQRTMQLNGMQDVIRVHNVPVQQAEQRLGPGSMDAIVCNPPYGVPGTTLLNPSDTLRTARHQDENGLMSWYKAAHRLLRGKGKFFMVYPAPRMFEAMTDLEKVHLTPKRFRLIYPRIDKPANLVLIEAMKDAKPMLHTEPPLIVYEQDGSMTAELKRIYHMT